MDNLYYLKPSLQKRQKRRDKRLHEEVIECYRTRPWKNYKRGYKQKQKRNNYEDAPKRESITAMHGGGTKYFTDHLAPLVRFLESNVGRPWSNVYSELNKRLDRSTVSGQHVIDHLWGFVEVNVWIDNKKVYHMVAGRKTELYSFRRNKQFYVHPVTGLLLKAKKHCSQYVGFTGCK